MFKITKEYKEIMKRVARANKNIKTERLAKLTWGNVSEISNNRKFIFIKPSGFKVDKLRWKDVSVYDIEGNQVFSRWKPSVDLPIHTEVYKKHNHISSIAHTHSTYATSFAQARKPLKIIGTTQADTFSSDIRVTEQIRKFGEFEKETGIVISNTLKNEEEAILVPGHGPFIFGSIADEVLKKSIILEEVAKMNYISTILTNNNPIELEEGIKNYHWKRKRENYGQ